MKRFLMTSLATMFATVCLQAADMKKLVVTTTPEMHCQKCENKIKSNIRFVKGVKDIQTNLETKQVDISYDADKSSVEDFAKAFQQIGYEITVIDNSATEKVNHKDSKKAHPEKGNKKKDNKSKEKKPKKNKEDKAK